MIPRRIIRQDCSDLTNQQATEWLREYGKVVEIQLRQVPRPAMRAGWFDEDDLRAVGQMAILEACQTYQQGRAEHIELRSWVGRVVGWRMRQAIKDAYKVSTAVGQTPPEWVTERVDEPDWLEVATLSTQVREAIAALGARDRLILFEHLAGETTSGIGKPLGVTGITIRQRIAWIEGRLREAVRGKAPPDDDDER